MESPPGNFSPPWKSRHNSLQIQRDTQNIFSSQTYQKSNCLGLNVQITFTIFLWMLNMGFFSLDFLLLLWGWPLFLVLFFVCCCWLSFGCFLFVCLFGGCIMLKQNQDLELCNDNYWNLVKHHPKKQQHVFHHRPWEKEECHLFPCLSKIGAIK